MSLTVSNAHKTHHLANHKAHTKQKASYPTLYTTKLQNSALLKKLESILGTWEKTAQANNAKAQKSKKLSSNKKELAAASLSTISGLKKSINENKYDFYIAYDKNNKVQAIATKRFAPFQGKKGVELSEIATHPDNVEIFGTKTAVRGAGTSLIKHIVQEMKIKKHKGSLHMVALNSAVPFYKKLGLACENAPGSSMFHICSLASKSKYAFLNAHKKAGSIKLKEPGKLF